MSLGALGTVRKEPPPPMRGKRSEQGFRAAARFQRNRTALTYVKSDFWGIILKARTRIERV